MFVLLFLVGAAFGSFLNVVSLRYKLGQKLFSFSEIGGRSCCPRCKKTLQWYELLPLISFLFLSGRCRTCKKRISFQYPIVEFLSGLVFLFVPLYFARFFNIGNLFLFRPELWGFYAFVLIWIVVFWFLLLMSVIDIRKYIIPNGINLILFVLGIFAFLLKIFSGEWLLLFRQSFVGSYAVLFTPFQNIFLNHLLGFFAGGLFFWAVYALTRGRGMGFGDVKLGFALGILLGWPDILFAMVFAFIVGGAWGVGVILFGRRDDPSTSLRSSQGKFVSRARTKFKSKLPFGPFFAIGTAIVVFAGHQILEWYFDLFSV